MCCMWMRVGERGEIQKEKKKCISVDFSSLEFRNWGKEKGQDGERIKIQYFSSSESLRANPVHRLEMALV